MGKADRLFADNDFEESWDLGALEAQLDIREKALAEALDSNERAQRVSEDTLQLQFQV